MLCCRQHHRRLYRFFCEIKKKMNLLHHPYEYLLQNVLILTSILRICLSAVENCFPCGPGEFCSNALGFCLSCAGYCPGAPECASACSATQEPKISTTSPLFVLTTTQSGLSSLSSSLGTSTVSTGSFNSEKSPTEEANTFSKNKGYLVLSGELVIGLFISLTFTLCLVYCCRKYCNTLKMPRLGCFSSSDSGNSTVIELSVLRETESRGNEGTIWTNPLDLPRPSHLRRDGYNVVQVDDTDENTPGPSGQRANTLDRQPPSHPRPVGYNVAQVDDIDENTPGPSGQRTNTLDGQSPSHPRRDGYNVVQLDVENIPGSSRQRASSPPRPNADTASLSQSVSGSGIIVEANRPFQSASIHPPVSPEREFEQHRGACPTNRPTFQNKTPETLRKITDGTPGVVSVGVRCFEPPACDMVDDIGLQWSRQPEDGD